MMDTTLTFKDWLNEPDDKFGQFKKEYSNIISNVRDNEVDIILPGVYSKKLQFTMSDHACIRWMERSSLEEKSQLINMLKIWFDGCLKEFHAFKDSIVFKNQDPRVFCISERYDRSCTIKLQKHASQDLLKYELKDEFDKIDFHKLLIVQINERGRNENRGTPIIMCDSNEPK